MIAAIVIMLPKPSLLHAISRPSILIIKQMTIIDSAAGSTNGFRLLLPLPLKSRLRNKSTSNTVNARATNRSPMIIFVERKKLFFICCSTIVILGLMDKIQAGILCNSFLL